MTQNLSISSGVVTFTVVDEDTHRLQASAASVTSWVPTSSDGDSWLMAVECSNSQTVDWDGLADVWSGGSTPRQLTSGNSVYFGMMNVAGTVIGFTLGDAAVTIPKGLVWNDQSGSVPSDNHARIMDMLNADGPGGCHIPRPARDEWLTPANTMPSIFERLYIDQPIELVTGNRISSEDWTCKLAPSDGANLPAVIAAKQWLDNTGGDSPSQVSRNIGIRDLGIDGNYRNRITGTELQTSNHGHGIAGTPYIWDIERVYIGQTRGFGILGTTTGEDGVTGLGEGIEMNINRCIIERTGMSAVATRDEAGVTGGITDGFLRDTVTAHNNTRGVTTGPAAAMDGAAVSLENSGGWVASGGHVYARETFAGGNFPGYGTPQITHGFVALSADGFRYSDYQIADFGEHRTYTGDCYGLWIRGGTSRAFHAGGDCNVGTEERSATIPNLWAVRFNTPGGGRVGMEVDGIVCRSRNASPTMKGAILEASSGGSIWGRVEDIVMDGVAIGDRVSTIGGALDELGAGLIIRNCAWDRTDGTNRETHTGTGGLVIDCRLGRRHIITLDGSPSSVTVINLPEGEVVEVICIANGASRNVNVSGAPTATGFTNPGTVALTSGQHHRFRFFGANGGDYLTESMGIV